MRVVCVMCVCVNYVFVFVCVYYQGPYLTPTSLEEALESPPGGEGLLLTEVRV